MKIFKSYIVLSLAALSLSLTSCDDFLDKLPDNRMELNNAKKVKQLLVSAYSNRNPALLFELASDNTDEFKNAGWSSFGLFQEQAYAWKDITEVTDDETPQRLWNSGYTALSTANEALTAIKKMGDTQAMASTKGEALLCRAYAAFTLANIFCMAYDPTTADKELGLPYPYEPEKEVGAKYKRGTLKEFYGKINADIEAGLPLVSDNYEHPKYHFTRAAAYAFAAQFNLFYHNYDKAIAYASRVLGTEPATKLRNWEAFYALSTNGQIAPNDYIKSTNAANILLQTVYSQAGLYAGPFNIANKYNHGQLTSENEDLQSQGPWGNSASFGYTVWSNNSVSKYFINKIPYAFEYSDIQTGTGYAHSQYSVFNTDALLLMRAEAYALKGDYTAALADINTELAAMSVGKFHVTLTDIQKFYKGIAYYTPTAPTPKKELNTSFAIEATKQEPLLQTILQLRRILTMSEGQRWLDVKRYGIVIYRRRLNSKKQILAITDTLAANDPRRAIQLPQDVIDAGLTANPRNK